MRTFLLQRQQQWWPTGLVRTPMWPTAELLPPEYLNRSNELFWIGLQDDRFLPITAGSAQTVPFSCPTEAHVIVLGGVVEVVDGAGAVQAWVPMTALLTDGTRRKLQSRPVPLRHLFGPSATQPAVWAFRKFFRAGSQLNLTIASRATVDFSVRPMLLAVEVFPQ